MNGEFIQEAIALSKQSVTDGGYPVGAVVAQDGEIVGRGVSNGKNLCDATMHAEIAAIRDASARLGVRNLTHAEMYASMEPCVMCCMACYWANLEKIYFAVRKEKLSKMHSEGAFDNISLIDKLNRPIEYAHAKAHEGEALAIITKWGQSSTDRFLHSRERSI